MENKTKASILTMLMAAFNSALLMVFNLVYNNIMISTYGSTLNGLVSTLTQFVSLFTIIEGGFTTAAIVATYEPIVKKDYQRLNDILYTTKRVYNKIGGVIAIVVLLAGLVYIPFINSPLPFLHTYSFLVVSALTTASSLCFLSKYSVLLQGYNREYIQVFLSLIARTITWIVSIVLILSNASLILVYSINLLNILLNILLSKIYEAHKFPYVNYKGKYDRKLISGTRDVLLQKIAGTIFTSTDLVLISAFISLASASVYNLYFHVFHAALTLLLSVAQAPFNSFGQLMKSENDKGRINNYFNIYQHFTLVISAIVLGIVGEIIIPFVRLYSVKFNDYDYVYPALALLFFSQIFAQVVNRPYGIILNASGNFKMQNKQCILAAIVNIIVSLAFIKPWGLKSIILGSFVGTLIILFMNIYQAYGKVLNVSGKRTIINLFANYISAIILIYISLRIDYICENYLQLVLISLLYALITLIIILGINFLIDPQSTRGTISFVRQFISKKTRVDNKV